VPAPAETTARPSGRVTVIVTVLKDPRVAETLESLLMQRRLPDEILVDDGGITDVVRRITERFHARDARVRHLLAPGNIPESRNTAIGAATGDFLAFLDADEVAPPGWLEELLRPFEDAGVGFTGGPTPGRPGTVRTVGARYYDAYLRRFYDTVARYRPHALPMGNSAWRKSALDQVGPLDTTLYRKAASEDQDIADRVLRAGFRGVYVPEAWVQHDFSDLTVFGLLRKQRIYAEGGYVVWRRRGTTYEATGGRLLPYVALPAAILAGAILWIPPATRVVGELLVLLGAVGLVVLAAALTVSGRRGESKYPGMKFRALEIPRRWATLYGAFRGFLTYGWSGRRSTVGRAPGKP
jgi:cellulose synthase/poly-beta-1,6-N-acetylglucosamine synthase-like glycosyltransferase